MMEYTKPNQTFKQLLVVVVLTVFYITVSMALVETMRAKRRPDFDDKLIPTVRRIWTTSERHVTFCVGECGRDESCVSVFYYKVNGSCQGHSTTFSDVAEATDQTDTRLYVLPRGEKYIGDSCSDVSDCVTTNSQCFNGTCLCIHGYSLKPTTYECLEDCAVYGKDFMEVRNYYISGTNRETLAGYSLEDCKVACRTRTDYLCRSFEYQWSAIKCFLTNVSVTHHPDRWYGDPEHQFNISYYQRDCQL